MTPSGGRRGSSWRSKVISAMTCGGSWRTPAGRRLHRDRARRELAVESPRYGYGQLLAGLQRRHSPQSAFREGQGTVLAAGLHEPDPVDHRAPPDATWRVGLRSAISTVVPSTRSSSARRSRRRRSHRRGRHRPGPSTSRWMAGRSSLPRIPSSLVTIGRRAGPASCGPPTTRSS